MSISALKLTNFRNYTNFTVNFAPKINIIIGPNGVGKTNLIEALYLLATTTTYKTSDNKKLVLWGKDFAKITAWKNNQEFELRIVLNNPLIKQIYISQVKRNLQEIIGKIPIVLFSPEIINQISTTPQLKRRFLNITISQTNKNYFTSLVDLKKIIQQKNKLLFLINQSMARPEELDVWDEKLAEVNQTIIAQRKQTIDFLNPKVLDYYQKISNSKDKMEIRYLPRVNQKNFWQFIKKVRFKEIEQKNTLYGPHRDQIIFLLNNKEISGTISRGELRSVVLALKLAELDFLEKESGEKVILLLDDIFSELDSLRKNQLLKLISHHQTFVTTTNLSDLSKIANQAKIIKLNFFKKTSNNVAKNRLYFR